MLFVILKVNGFTSSSLVSSSPARAPALNKNATHATQRYSPEEDEGVSKPVSLTVEGNLVHQRPDCRLVVRAGGDLGLAQARIPQLEVGVQHPVEWAIHLFINLLIVIPLYLLGNPRMQILIPSSTPLQVSWCMISGGSTFGRNNDDKKQ